MDQWRDIMAHIKKLQPHCLVLGNNSHKSSDTDIHSFEFPIYRNESGYPPANNAIPSEVCDTLAANGCWFWHPGSEKQMRSAADIVGVLRKCNTRRANYLLDVPPDRTGRIPEALVARLKEIVGCRPEVNAW
jgi:alpha-L-fucosidase